MFIWIWRVQLCRLGGNDMSAYRMVAHDIHCGSCNMGLNEEASSAVLGAVSLTPKYPPAQIPKPSDPEALSSKPKTTLFCWVDSLRFYLQCFMCRQSEPTKEGGFVQARTPVSVGGGTSRLRHPGISLRGLRAYWF